MMNKLLIAASAVMAASFPIVSAQSMSMSSRPPLSTTNGDLPTLPEGACVCTPREYTFQLNFNGGCNDETYMDNMGIEGSLCFFTQGNTPEDVADGDVGIPGIGGGTRRRLRSSSMNTDNTVFGRKVNDNKKEEEMRSTNNVVVHHHTQQQLDRTKILTLLEQAKDSFSSHYDHAAAKMQQQQQQDRHIQALDTQVTSVTSVTFLEFDADFNYIINQNSEYFETSLSNGEEITYPSISAQLDVDKPLDEQSDLVPGGVMVVLFGPNREGIVVQNTVVWGYELDNCSGVPVNTGDVIGWTKLQQYKSPRAEFCEGVTNYPTVVPSSSPTTASPTESPITTEEPTTGFVKAAVTDSPTPAPLTPSPVTSAPIVPIAAYVAAAKSGKSKTGKSSGCGGKSGKSKSSKNGIDCMSMGHIINQPYLMFSKGSKMFSKSTTGQLQVPRPDGKATKLFKHTSKSSKIGSTVVHRPKGLTTSSGKSGKSSGGSTTHLAEEAYLGYDTGSSMSMMITTSEVESTDSPISSSPTLPPIEPPTLPPVTPPVVPDVVATPFPTATNLGASDEDETTTTDSETADRPPLDEVQDRPPLVDALANFTGRPPLPDENAREDVIITTSAVKEPTDPPTEWYPTYSPVATGEERNTEPEPAVSSYMNAMAAMMGGGGTNDEEV